MTKNPTALDTLTPKRKILVALSTFYIILCGALGTYLCQPHLNIELAARIAVLAILTFNMFLPFLMVYIWILKDGLKAKDGH